MKRSLAVFLVVVVVPSVASAQSMGGQSPSWTAEPDHLLYRFHDVSKGATQSTTPVGERVPAVVVAPGAGMAQAAEQNLLRQLDTVEVPAVTRFVAEDAFTKANGIAYMGGNFKQFLLPKMEENIASATLTISELTRAAKDLRITADLGVDEKGEVALAHFSHLLAKQSRGEAGPLRTDGWANGAYIIGTDGNTWTVRANLYSDGWYVSAYRLGIRGRWNAGLRFLSR